MVYKQDSQVFVQNLVLLYIFIRTEPLNNRHKSEFER